MDNTTKLNLPIMRADQAQKHVTFNESLVALDTLTQLQVIDKDLNSPPASPLEGDTYIVGPSGSGGWLGESNTVATYFNDLWYFYTPNEGWLAYVVDEGRHFKFDGTSWVLALDSVGDSYGWQNFQDTATASSAISIGNGAWTDLTNDGLGALTSTTYKVTGHGDIWDSSTNTLDFSSLSVGDVVTFRVDVEVTTGGANHDIDFRLAFGPSYSFSNNFETITVKSAGTKQIFKEFSFAMFNTDTLNNPAKLQIQSDSSGDTAKVNGWFIQTKVR